MVKRKATSSCSEEENSTRETKKLKNSENSFIAMANIKNNKLHKGLNLSLSLQPIKTEGQSASDTNEESTNVSKKKKNKKKNVTFNDTLNSVNNIENGIVDQTSKNSGSPLKNHNKESTYQSNSARRPTEDDDDNDIQFMNSMEEKINSSKVNILENITIPSSKDPKQQLIKFFPNLKLETIKTDIKSKDSHDIYLLRVPKNVDPQALLEADINLDGGKINIGEKYLIKPTSKVPPPMMVLSTSKNVFHFKGNIVMEKYVKPQKEPKIPVKEKSSITLPDNLKNRHPLFGNDFEDKIHLPQQVEDKLNTAIEKLLKKEKKAKKKQNKVEEVEKEPVFNLLNSSSSSSDKKKPTKNELIEETLKLMKQEINPDSPVKKKKKKSKSVSSPVAVKEELQSDQELPKKSKKSSMLNSTLLPSINDTPKFNSEISKISDVFLETTPRASKKKTKPKGKIQI